MPGATGYVDTNYEGKASYALESLEEKDFVMLKRLMKQAMKEM